MSHGKLSNLLQVEVQIVAITVFEDSAEGVGIDLEDVEELDDSRVLEVLVDVVLAQRVLDVVGLLVVLPLLAQLVDLASNVALLLHVEGLEEEVVRRVRHPGSVAKDT